MWEIKFLKDSEIMFYENKNKEKNPQRLSSLKIKSLIEEKTRSSSMRGSFRGTVIIPGKLNESEVTDIFSNLTGKKNFTDPMVITQFDKNSGVTTNIGQGMRKSTLIDPTYLLKIKTNNVPKKMDFFLFIKSFELISIKIYKDTNSLDDAFSMFLEKNVPKIFSNFGLRFNKMLTTDSTFSLKEKLIEVRSESVVKLFKFSY